MRYIDSFKFPGVENEEQFVNYIRRTCYTSFYPFGVFAENELRELSFSEITILYGNNGSGKSTALNLMAEKLGMSEAEAKSFVPAPRSIDGKCGGYLSVVAMLEKPGIDKAKEYEQMFLEKNGSLFCKELIARRSGTGRTCNDIVGEAAAMMESLL